MSQKVISEETYTAMTRAIAELQAENERLRSAGGAQKDNWISVAERLPQVNPDCEYEVSESVAVWTNEGSFETAFYHFMIEAWCSSVDGSALDVTHWQPIMPPTPSTPALNTLEELPNCRCALVWTDDMDARR